MLNKQYFGEVKIKSSAVNAIEIVPNSCNFFDSKGVSAPENSYLNGQNSITATCEVTSTFSKATDAIPQFITRSPSIFGTIVSPQGSLTQIILDTGTNTVSVSLPLASQPQNYSVSFSFMVADQSTTSNAIIYDYTQAGILGALQNVVFDKNS